MSNILINILFLSTFLLSADWVGINSNVPQSPYVELINSDIESAVLKMELNGFNLKSHLIEEEEYFSVDFPTSASLMNAGYPDLPKFSKSIIIPNNKSMKYTVIDSEYIEYQDINIAPSKGNILRNINPESVPYTFDSIYNSNEFYPSDLINLGDPYILRDFRGVSVQFNPIKYNPYTKVLRVYKTLIIEVQSDGFDSINVLERNNFVSELDKEFKNIYQNQFLNFESDLRFDYLVDQGRMLIISDLAFMDTMQPLVDWKNLKGIPTELVNVSDIGANATAISNYVSNYYNTNGLTFLLLVGDIAQIPSPLVSGSASDISYGCISGNDFYPEVLVGRFSGSNPAHISTQVERTISYERYPQSGAEWYDNALGVASNQGPGFNGYTDDDFSQFLWDDILSDFTYDSYEGIYDGSGGTTSAGISAINSGVSLINYTGHGSISSWGNGAPINTSQVNQFTNNNKLPFVITVGCNVGEFNSTNECYTESWMRATNNGEPTGSIAHFGSTISQSWEPPMHGQYAMNLILTESYDSNITRSMGGIAFNGCMYMNDAQGSAGINETKYWTFFGDPSTNIRTAPPVDLSVNHDDVVLVNQQEFVVDIGEDGALAAISRDGELLSSAYSTGGVAILNLGDAASSPGSLDLVVTGFNSYPYETELMVIAPEGAYVVIDDIEVQYGSVDNGHLLYGQENYLTLYLSNVGSDDIENLTVEISSDSEYANMIQDNASYSSVLSNQSIEVQGLNVGLDWNVPDGELINIAFVIQSESESWESTVSFIAQSPDIVLDSMSGNLESGESTTLEIALSNVGSAPINYPIVSARGDSYVSVSSSGIGNAYYWGHELNNQEVLYADVFVSPNTPIGYVAEIMVNVTNLNGGLDIEFPVYFSVGQITENFESEFNPALNWSFSGNSNWDLTTSDQYEGYYSAKSGNIDNNQVSDMSVTLDVVIDGTIDFYYRVASEYSPSGLYFYDGLEFYIDDEMVGQYQPNEDGSTPWTFASFPVQAGTHTFKWSYVKDGAGGSTDMEEDCAWVDYILFPPATLNDDNEMLGDINGDGSVSILDVVQIINMVLESTPDENADINNDGTVDVLDIILLVNIILEA